MINEVRTAWKHSHLDTFENLIQIWHSQPYSYEVESNDFLTQIQTNSALKQILNIGLCITWIFDVRTQQYSFVSNNVKRLLGYSSQAFINGGIRYTKDLLHPDDSLDFWKVMHQIWKVLLALPAKQRQNFQYNCEYRLRKANGSYIRLLEQNTVLHTDQKGNITHLVGICIDITKWKKSNMKSASIVFNDKESCSIYMCDHDYLDNRQLLSERQKEVLKLVAEGYSSKRIADRLSISYHTVNTHRKKMIEKTSTKTTGALVQFAISNGLI